MYKLGNLENNGQNQDVSQCNNRDVFTGHNMNNTSCSLSSPPSDNATKSTTTSVLRRWRRPDTHDSGSKNVQAKDAPINQPAKYVSAEPDKQMNQVGNYVGGAETSSSNTGSDYSMFVPQLSPVVPQSTARPYDSTKYLQHVQYSENGGYARTSPVVASQTKVPDKTSGATSQSSYYHQDNTNQEVHFRSPNYPIQNTPPLAHSASQKCILPNENNTYPVTNQNVSRDYSYLRREYPVVAHNYSPQKINQTEAKISPQGVTEDSSYCLSKTGGYVQDSRISPQNITHNYPHQNALDRRVSPHNPKSPIYRNYPQNNGSAVMDSRINIPAQNYVPSSKSSGDYGAQNTSYYMDKPPCLSQKQGYSPEKQVLDARYVQNYSQNYVVSKNQLVNPQDSKHPRDYRNAISNSKKASPPFPILEQRLNQTEGNYCADYSAQGYYPSKYGPVMFSRTSPTPKIVRDGSVAGHNYIASNVHHNSKIPPQDMMIPPNYSLPNKYYQQNQGQEWKIPKEYEQNMYLSQMNQMHARLPHNAISKTTDLPRDLSYVDQNQRVIHKGRMYCHDANSVEHLQYTNKSVVPLTQKSPKMVGYNISDQRPPENQPNDYLNLSRSCGTVMKPTDYQRSSKVSEYSPVIQSVKAAELGYDPKMSRDYLMHQQTSDQQSYVCSPPLIGQNSRNPPPYPVGYPRQSNIKLNEMPARNISPRRTFQENMPVVVFSPQHIGLPKSSPSQMYPPEYNNPQQYPGYYPRDSVYPGSGVKSGMPQYPVDQSGKYSNLHVNRNISQQRFPFGYPEHQYYQHKHLESPDKINYYQGNMYRAHYNPNLPEHLQQNVARAFEGDYRNAASNYSDFEASRVDDRSVYSKKDSDIGKSLKEFLESWEDDEEIVANLPDLVLCNNIPSDKQKLPFGDHSEEASETSKSSSDEDSPKENDGEQPLYILGSTNISSEALPQYLAVYEQVDKLPDNIKGYFKNPSSNIIEEAQPANTENNEKQTEKSPDPKSVIRESLSPHDLTVNKSRDEKKIDEVEVEEVLNLSTNRNKENDEFLVEEYSNASEDNTSVQDHETEKEVPTTEPDTSHSKIEKSLEHEVAKIVEPSADKQEETAKDNEMPKSISDVEDKIKDVDNTNENQLSSSENQSLPKDSNCIVMDKEEKSENTITKTENKGDSTENKSFDEDTKREEDQPKIPSGTSVIVPNKFFDNASLISKNDLSEKLSVLSDEPIEIKDDENENTESKEIILEIPDEECEETKSKLLEELASEKTMEIVETNKILEEIVESKSSQDEAAVIIDTDLDINVIDFETEELLPLNEDLSKEAVIEKLVVKDIEHQEDEIATISFDNLINSPENIEMKDDEESITDLENNSESFNKSGENKQSKEVISSPSTPNCIDLSLPESICGTDTEISLMEDVIENTEQVEEVEDNSEIVESDKPENDHLLPTQTDTEIITEKTNVNSENISEQIEHDHAKSKSEDLETQIVNEDATSKDSEVTENKLENFTEEYNNEDSKCTSLLSLSPIPECDIKVESEEFELKTSEENIEDTETSTTVCSDKEVDEYITEPETEVVSQETEEQIPEVNQDIVESGVHFESTVDKLIITNVESIQDDSNDSISQEETANEPVLEEENNITETNKTTTEDVQEELEETEKIKDDNLDEYAHLVDIVKSEDALIKVEENLSKSNLNSKDLKENAVDAKEINKFDFSYLESCTDNICEKSQDTTEILSDDNSADKNKREELCNNDNLKSILDSSESESEIIKDKEINATDTISNEQTIINESEIIPENITCELPDIETPNSNSQDIITPEETMNSFPEISQPQDSENLKEPEKVSEEAFHPPETDVRSDIPVENEDNLVVPEINEVPETQISIPVVETETNEQQLQPETSEDSSEVPVNNIELPESSTEIVPIETVEENVEINITDSVLVTESSSEENIVLPEDSECVVIYSEDEQYVIIQPDTDTAEIIPSEDIIIQETEIMIPETIPSEVESQKEEEIIVATEPVGEEIIICEEGIEDWVQNEEIIESNEEDRKITELGHKNEETEQINFENKELLLDQKKKDDVKQKVNILGNKRKLKMKKLSVEKKKLLIAKQKRNKQKFEKQTHLKVKKITETFINEEKMFCFPDSKLTINVEEKELFINPENPDTIEYNNNSSNFLFPDSSSVLKRRVSYGDSLSPKIDFKAPKRRYSNMESDRSVKKPIINLDEISKNITEVLENLTKQEIKQYQNVEKTKHLSKVETKKDETKHDVKGKEKEETNSNLNDGKVEKKLETKIDHIEKELPSKIKNILDIKPKLKENLNDTNDSAISTQDNVTKLVEQLIKPKLIIPKTNFNFVTNTSEIKSISPLPVRKVALLETPEIKEDHSSPVLSTSPLVTCKSSLTKTPESKEVISLLAKNSPLLTRKSALLKTPEMKEDGSSSVINNSPSLTHKPALLKTPEMKEDNSSPVINNSLSLNRKPALLKTPEIKEDSCSPVLNTARLTEPIFPKSSVSEMKTKRQISDPRIDRLKELPLPAKEEKQSLIENKLSNTFGLTEYTKNYIKMKTGQTVDPKNVCRVNGSKSFIHPKLTKIADQSTTNFKINNAKKKNQNVLDNINNDDIKNNEKKVKINLQDYRNRKSQSSDSNVSSTEDSMSSSQNEDIAKKDSEEIKSDESEKHQKENSENIVEKLMKPKKSSEPLLTQEVTKVTTNPEEPKVTNSTNNDQVDCNNLETDSNVNFKSKIDLKSKPKKRKRRFRNLYTVDEEDEVPTKQSKNSLDSIETKLNGILTTNEDSTSSSKISEDSQQSTANSSSSGSKMNEDSQSSEVSSGTNGEFLCCLDLNTNGTTENDCGFKCHIKLNAIGEKIRDYEINKNSCSNPNRLKLTLKPVKKKKPAFSEVLSNLDSLVESELHSKRKKKLNGSKNSVSEKNGDGTLWTIKNKIPKVIIKRNASGYCAVFRDVSSNPIWQPKIRLKRQKYIESLVLSNVKF